jgi:hypothetical protein
VIDPASKTRWRVCLHAHTPSSLHKVVLEWAFYPTTCHRRGRNLITTANVGVALDHPEHSGVARAYISFLFVFCLFLFGFFVLFWFVLVLVFRDSVSLYSPGCPGTHFVDQAGLELRNPPASASRVPGLKACATTPGCRLTSLSVYVHAWPKVLHFCGKPTTLFKAWFAETKVREDMQVLGMRLQCSRLHSVHPQGQPSCVLADRISALCPDFFFLQIQLSLFNPQLKKKIKMPIRKQGKHFAVPACPVSLGRLGWVQEEKVGGPGFPGRTISRFTCRSPALSTTRFHRERKAWPSGLSQASTWPTPLPVGWSGHWYLVTTWLVASFLHV